MENRFYTGNTVKLTQLTVIGLLSSFKWKFKTVYSLREYSKADQNSQF
jgi:hypothetical protein